MSCLISCLNSDMHGTGNMALLITQMIIYNWHVMMAKAQPTKKNQMKLWPALAALHSFHRLVFLFGAPTSQENEGKRLQGLQCLCS